MTDNVSVSGATLDPITTLVKWLTNQQPLDGNFGRIHTSGLEYYLSATDGVSTTYSGRAETLSRDSR